jgi:hypothetical protein
MSLTTAIAGGRFGRSSQPPTPACPNMVISYTVMGYSHPEQKFQNSTYLFWWMINQLKLG